MKQTQKENSSKYRCNTNWIFHRKSIYSCSNDGWQLATMCHWMWKPGNYVAIQLQPVLLDRISSHPSLTLYWLSYSTLHCCLNTYEEINFKWYVKASNFIWSVDWTYQKKKFALRWGDFQSCENELSVLTFVRASSDCTYTLQRKARFLVYECLYGQFKRP